MNLIERQTLPAIPLPGRILQKAIGPDAASPSDGMAMGFARYCAEAGPMEPHHHAEEIVYILKSDGGYVRHGDDPAALGERVPLTAGMTLHFPALEWHVFEYDTGGEIEIIFFYGQTDNLRPEEKR